MRPLADGWSAPRWCVLLLAAAIVMTLGACSASAPAKSAATPTASGTPAQTSYDLAYADASPLQQLDLYPPVRAAGPAPLLIWIHGGGWRAGDKSAIAAPYNPAITPPKPAKCNQVVEVQKPDVAALNAKGYAVASINYRLTRDPVAAVQDAKAAVRFLRANASRYHLDPQRFAAWGDSAGGYSAIMLGVTGGLTTVFDDPALGHANVSAAVQAVVDWFGPTEASSLPGRHSQAELPFTYLTARRSLPPFRIANGDADCVVPPGQSRRLLDALTKVGTAATLAILPGAGHEDPAFMRTQLAPTVAFLDQTIGPK